MIKTYACQINVCYNFLTEKILMSPCEQFRYLLKQIQIGPKLLIHAKFNY